MPGPLLFSSALAAWQSGQLGRATEICQEILRGNRRDADALDLLGQIAFARGAYGEAEQSMTRLAALRPRDARPLLVLAEIHTYQGRYREALDRYDRALKLAPGLPAAIAGKADVYEKRGLRDKARALLAPLVKSGRESPEMAVVAGRLDLHEGRLDDLVARSSRHVEADGAAQGSARAHLLFLRGKAHERAGRIAEAFSDYERANAMLSVPFSMDALVRHTDELIATYTAERLASLPRATNGSNVPVFIVGMPRSGSTLVESIIDAHPMASGAGELPALQEIVNGLSLTIGSTLPYPACVADLAPDDVEAAGKAYLDRLPKAPRGTERIVDKFLNNHRHLGLIALILPQASVIHCRRDPSDACLSCFAEPLPSAAYPFTTSLRGLGEAWNQYERIMDHWRRVLPEPPLEIQYESLVADPEGLTRAILDFLGLPFDEKCLRYWESGRVARTASYDQVNRPIYTGSVGRARRFERHLAPLREALGR